ncbi:hypothetical protein HYV74_02480 [Candidatus Uhrbacteria bacterium]|nr:hypothetical protein [Candidatus Uhrbacteria bacterium]
MIAFCIGVALIWLLGISIALIVITRSRRRPRSQVSPAPATRPMARPTKPPIIPAERWLEDIFDHAEAKLRKSHGTTRGGSTDEPKKK